MQKPPGKPAPSQKTPRGTVAKNPPQVAPLQKTPSPTHCSKKPLLPSSKPQPPIILDQFPPQKPLKKSSPPHPTIRPRQCWWFFTNPFGSKLCDRQIFDHFPMRFGVNITKIFELPAPSFNTSPRRKGANVMQKQFILEVQQAYLSRSCQVSNRINGLVQKWTPQKQL